MNCCAFESGLFWWALLGLTVSSGRSEDWVEHEARTAGDVVDSMSRVGGGVDGTQWGVAVPPTHLTPRGTRLASERTTVVLFHPSESHPDLIKGTSQEEPGPNFQNLLGKS